MTIQLLRILEETKRRLEAEESDIEKGEAFENKVFEVMHTIATENDVSNIRQTGAQTFPDIVIEGYGIEVKFSKSAKWESTGNSTFESTFDRQVTNEIYLLFGRKNGNRIEVRYDKYENCLSDVKVTHKPRFMINMDMSPGENVLSQLGLTYEAYRLLDKKEKEKTIREFLERGISQGEEIVEIDEDAVTSARIKHYNNFDIETKKRIHAELYIYFPVVLGNRSDKYKDVAAYLIKQYNAFHGSIRDIFSAGGKANRTIQGNVVSGCPQKYCQIYDDAKDFEFILNNTTEEKLYEYWKKYDVSLEMIKRNRITVWKSLIDQFGEAHGSYRPSDFYESGYPHSRKTLI